MPPDENAYYIKKDLIPRYRSIGGSTRPLMLDFNSLNHVRVKKDYHYRPHIHAYYELIMPLEGRYRCRLNGEELELGTDELLLVQFNDEHEDYYVHGQFFTAILFHLRDFSRRPWRHGIIRPEATMKERIFSIEPDSSLGHLKRIIIAETDKDDASMLIAESLCETFFWVFAATLPDPLLSDHFRNCLRHDQFRRRVFDLFANHLGRNLDTKVLAERFGVSLRTLDYRFQEIMGTTPAKAFRTYRIKEAMLRLESGHSIGEIAEALGFADPFHFSKVFKRVTGFSPSEVRKRL